MSGLVELVRPQTAAEFEALCHQLYKAMWNDPSCMFVGRQGQAQFGVDIVGRHGNKHVGVQCKHYVKSKFGLETVLADLQKVDEAALEIDHLVFSTTAASSSELVKDIIKLSNSRIQAGKCTVSVDHWEDICANLRLHPSVGRQFIPNFPGSNELTLVENSERILDIVAREDSEASGFRSESRSRLERMEAMLLEVVQAGAPPSASGEEVDSNVAATLDHVRDKIKIGKIHDAGELLSLIGPPTRLRDAFSRFRWYTSSAAIEVESGNAEAAAAAYLNAYEERPDIEKAASNRAYAQLLLKNPERALEYCEEALSQFPESPLIWAIKLHSHFQLGLPEPEIPTSIAIDSGLLYARASLRTKKGDVGGAVVLLRQLVDSPEGPTLDAKRAFLAESLAWIAADPVLAHHGEYSAEQRESLVHAISLFEPVDQILGSIQSPEASVEISSNIINALALVDRRVDAERICDIALSLHPRVESILRFKIVALIKAQNVAAVRAFADSRMDILPSSTIAILSEVAANEGDLDWLNRLLSVMNREDLAPGIADEIEVMSVLAKWRAGKKAEAVDAIESLISQNPTNVAARSLKARFLVGCGDRDSAETEAIRVHELVASSDETAEIARSADLLFDLGLYQEAATDYARLSNNSSGSTFTRRLLICLVKSDQRARARKIIELMSGADRDSDEIKSIECNLAARMGDWARVRILLESSGNRIAESGDFAVSYAGALYRLGEEDGLKEFLVSDPRFSKATPEEEFEFAKYQRGYGFQGLAVARLLRLFAQHPGDSTVAGYYLSQLLLCEAPSELTTPSTVRPGCAVSLATLSESWTVVVDEEPPLLESGWPEVVTSVSDLAKALIGQKIGDQVRLRRGPIELLAEIKAITTLQAFAADKAHALIASSAEASGPLSSFRIVRDDGTIDLESISAVLAQKRLRSEELIQRYREQVVPVCVLASALSSDPISLLLDWPFNEVPLFVGSGSIAEQDESRGLLRSGRRFAMDIMTLAEIKRLGVERPVFQVLGRPYAPNSAKEALQTVVQLQRDLRPTASMTDVGGRIRIVEHNEDERLGRIRFISTLASLIDETCDVMPVAGPPSLSRELALVFDLLDKDSGDTLLLCAEKDLVFITDDCALRRLAQFAGINGAVGLQAVLLEAVRRGLLKHLHYAHAIAQKARMRHEFLIINTADLVVLAMAGNKDAAADLKSLLMSLSTLSLDLNSGLQMFTSFISTVGPRLPSSVVAYYSRIGRDALVSGRHEHVELVESTIGRALQRVYGRHGSKLTKEERRKFKGLL